MCYLSRVGMIVGGGPLGGGGKPGGGTLMGNPRRETEKKERINTQINNIKQIYCKV